MDFINNRFISTLIGQKTFTTDIVTAIVNTYAELDESFLEVAKQNNFYSGCTSNNVILIKCGLVMELSVVPSTRRQFTVPTAVIRGRSFAVTVLALNCRFATTPTTIRR